MEREKSQQVSVVNGSGCDAVAAERQQQPGSGGYSSDAAAMAGTTCTVERTEQGYVPTVGRWGWGPTGATGNPDHLLIITHQDNGNDHTTGHELHRASQPSTKTPNTTHHHDDTSIINRNYNIDEVELKTLVCETQEEGPWPIGHPLPLPTWSAESKHPYYTPTVWQYEELATNIELNVQRLLDDHHYNTVGNFLDLYRQFKATGRTDNLDEFFHRYMPTITADHHTCVGLSLELWNRLKKLDGRFPGLAECLYLVSCEESIDCLPEYVDIGDHLDVVADTVEKEHVLLALKINVDGRTGVLLCDPGYHVARVITVMKDRAYPHTGWFTQSDESSIRRDYCYTLCKLNSKYIEWTECETRNDVNKTTTALIYASRPYMTAVDVTERRNVVYDFRNYLTRDTKGHLLAGLYFKVKPHLRVFTLFYQDHGRKRLQMDFDKFLTPDELNDEYKSIIKECNKQMKLADNILHNTICDLAKCLSDSEYITQLLNINTNINRITEDN